MEVVEALLKVWRTTGEQLVTLHRRVSLLAQTDETCRRLITVPGLARATAAAFRPGEVHPERFRRLSSVGAYLGLTPPALPVGRDRLHGLHLQARRWAHAWDLPVRSRQCAA